MTIRHMDGVRNPDRLNSPLLLSWVAQAGRLDLYDSAHNTPGLAELLAAAVRMTSLCTECTNLVAAAEADHLISKCCSLIKLRLSGTFLPSIFPEALEELRVCVGDKFDPRQVNALLYHCTRLPHLQLLRLGVACTQPVRLTCAAQLRKLHSLGIGITLTDAVVSLKWALAQPCTFLDFWVRGMTNKVDSQTALVQQLATVRMHTLTLEMNVQYTAAMQALWAKVQTGSFTLLARSTQESVLLHMLPCCGIAVLDSSQPSSSPPAVCIRWAALIRYASVITVRLATSTKLHVTGCELTAATIDQLQRPWQLIVFGGAGVHGLPASQPTRHAYFVQNAAAQAAGWTDSIRW